MKKDLCVKVGSYNANGKEKSHYENIGLLVDDENNNPYILLKPWINLAGFPRDEGRNNLLVSLFEHKDYDQRRQNNSDTEEFNSTVQNYETNEAIPF